MSRRWKVLVAVGAVAIAGTATLMILADSDRDLEDIREYGGTEQKLPTEINDMGLVPVKVVTRRFTFTEVPDGLGQLISRHSSTQIPLPSSARFTTGDFPNGWAFSWDRQTKELTVMKASGTNWFEIKWLEAKHRLGITP